VGHFEGAKGAPEGGNMRLIFGVRDGVKYSNRLKVLIGGAFYGLSRTKCNFR
jgi:hypothetical protein